MRCCNRKQNCYMQNSYNCRCNNSNQNTCNSNVYSNICNSSDTPFPSNYVYGHAYTPNQIMNKTFIPEVGLENGTVFPELVSPYYPGQSIDFINYLKNGGI